MSTHSSQLVEICGSCFSSSNSIHDHNLGLQSKCVITKTTCPSFCTPKPSYSCQYANFGSLRTIFCSIRYICLPNYVSFVWGLESGLFRTILNYKIKLYIGDKKNLLKFINN